MEVVEATPTARGNDPCGYTVKVDGRIGKITSARYGGKLDGTVEVTFVDGSVERHPNPLT